MSRLSFRSLLRRSIAGPSFRLPEGQRVYAIGDIHGRLDCLRRVEKAIRSDWQAHGGGKHSLVIFLGDYIDRGDDSRGVIESLVGGTFAGLPARFLMGNHEDAMLQFLEDATSGSDWLAYGGAATLASYGVALTGDMGADRLEGLRQRLLAVLPSAHRIFLENLELTIIFGDYLFVHAGIRPRKKLENQNRCDLLTIREPFLSARDPAPWRVVHGHTIVAEPEFTPYRIGIDTGAYATGILTCIVIDGEHVASLEL